MMIITSLTQVLIEFRSTDGFFPVYKPRTIFLRAFYVIGGNYDSM